MRRECRTNVRSNDVDGGSSLSSDKNSSELAHISTLWFWPVSGDQHIASGMGVLQKTAVLTLVYALMDYIAVPELHTMIHDQKDFRKCKSLYILMHVLLISLPHT